MATQPHKNRSGLERVLLGCAFGCGGLIVLALIASGFGAFWFFTPGEQVATAKIVGEESLGLVRMNELARDQGTQALLSHVLNKVEEVSRRQQRETLPESMQWTTQFQRSARASDLNKFIPKEATVVLEGKAAGEGTKIGAAEDPDFVVAANFRTMVRPLKAILSLVTRGENQDALQSRYRQHEILHFSSEGAIATFVGSTLLISNSQAALYRALDRIDGVAPSGAERLDSEVPEGTWDAIGVIANEGGAALVLLRMLMGSPSFEPPSGELADFDLRFGLDVVSADEMTARIFLDGQNERQAPLWLEAIENESESLRKRAAEWGLVLDIGAEVQGDRVTTRIRLTGLESAIENLVQFD